MGFNLIEYLGFLGIVLSALIASVAYFYKAKVGRKKCIRRVLYYVLELRWVTYLSTFDEKKAYKEFVIQCNAKMEENGERPGDEESYEFVREHLETHFKNIIDASKDKLSADFIKAIDKSLLELAEYEPLLAYLLRGQYRVGSLLKTTANYAERSEKVFIESIEEPVAKKALKGSLKKCHAKTEIEVFLALDEAALLLAKKSGVGYKGKLKKLLKESHDLESRYDFPALDDLFDTLSKDLNKVSLTKQNDTG